MRFYGYVFLRLYGYAVMRRFVGATGIFRITLKPYDRKTLKLNVISWQELADVPAVAFQ